MSKLPPFADDRLPKPVTKPLRMSDALWAEIERVSAVDGKKPSDWMRSAIVEILRQRRDAENA